MVHGPARFPGLLRELQAKKAPLGVLSYGLSSTTLEEVFLKVASSGDSSSQGPEGLLRDGKGPAETRVDVGHGSDREGGEAAPLLHQADDQRLKVRD